MIVQILQHLVDNPELSMVGEPTTADEYAEQVTWLDNRPQPTWAEIEAARGDVEKQLHNTEAELARADAYRTEADPLYFGWQRNENTEQEWLDKVAEIRARYPYA